ncbi:hypothetical protein TNCV_1379241 [Trichonephila clavipes]|nr:hypothetical protein TNCV_1379241 [Trichonephila clavipes]
MSSMCPGKKEIRSSKAAESMVNTENNCCNETSPSTSKEVDTEDNCCNETSPSTSKENKIRKRCRNRTTASTSKIFSSIVREFLELFYNLWRTVLAKNKIVLDSALRLQSFRIPENATIGVRSGIECQQQERWRPSSRLF